ncbi:MAG: YggS family pyridoxal phosphate-dependent enzyme [Hydrogenovibrio sp.]|uniref:YggS family pyridoxal phosphate-dependent enzyme n=1 Tax=Hydrogenovibrio sp. TaxID=2065821 RepID=UPI0028705129|nr:YggS family pyridoxal phosphate-dependent enzyme [Hydrogenovibrio sp.]MDR9498014.1 YggS family pyridoxal phosphate-dependent enzyme [Hydrogenovibrio sp.]
MTTHAMPDADTQATLKQNFDTVRQRLHAAAEQAGRSVDAIQLLAVSKTKPIEYVNAIAEQGQTCFGENYLQEALEKIEQRPDLTWHFIGPIQSNKTKSIAEQFDWVESVDRLKIARRLSSQRPPEKGHLNILLEVNISDQESKAGFAPEEVLDIAKEVQTLPNLTLRGLMTIPAPSDTLDAQRQPLAKMRALLAQLQQQLPDAQLDTLSMGMSGDLEAAVLEGSTEVRIGTDLFGARN